MARWIQAREKSGATATTIGYLLREEVTTKFKTNQWKIDRSNVNFSSRLIQEVTSWASSLLQFVLWFWRWCFVWTKPMLVRSSCLHTVCACFFICTISYFWAQGMTRRWSILPCHSFCDLFPPRTRHSFTVAVLSNVSEGRQYLLHFWRSTRLISVLASKSRYFFPNEDVLLFIYQNERTKLPLPTSRSFFQICQKSTKK